MLKISDLLQKFTKLAEEGDEIRNQIVEVLKNNKIIIRDIKTIKIQKGIVTIKLSPIQKSEIALRQKNIIDELSKNPLTKNITLVR